MVTNELVDVVANDLHMQQEPKEPERCFAERLLYSAGSAWFRALMREENGMPSLSRIRRRLNAKCEYLVKAFPPLSNLHESNVLGLTEQVINLHREVGTVFHTSHYVSPAPEASGTSNGITVFRCGFPGERYYYSGLGIFRPNTSDGLNQSLYSIYGLDSRSVDAIADDILHGRSWHPIEHIEGIQYLNTNHQAGQPLYMPNHVSSDPIILARCKADGAPHYTYYLFRGVQYSVLSDWEFSEGYHRILALSFYKRNQSPLVTIKHGQFTVDMQLHFPLPRDDELLLQFWAWPKNMQHRFVISNRPVCWN